jgi:AcrR family transcriptional regulator
MPAVGRRPGTNDTRAVLLQAAAHRFATSGYDKTSVRNIAAAAGVDPALIRHYFGSKAGLFRPCMGWPFEPADVAARITGGDPGSTGERLAQVFFEFLGATPIPCRVDGDPARRGNP